VDTYANLPDGVTGRRRFLEEERAYRLEAMQYLVADMEAHYATLPNQPNLRYVTGPPPANVGLWPIAPLTHPESEESEEEGPNNDEGPPEAGGAQGVTAPSGPVMAPPSIVPPAFAPTVPTTSTTGASTPTIIPTPTVTPIPVATPTVPVTQPTEGPAITATATGAQLPRERPPATGEQQAKRVATSTAASLQGPQLAAGGGTIPSGPAAGAVAPEEAQADQQWEVAKAEVQRLWTLAQNLQTEARTKANFTAFRDQANSAQDALHRAEDVSRQAREEQMAAAGALPVVGLQIRGAPSVVVPSEQFEADCREAFEP
jgi:hypothetical protein